MCPKQQTFADDTTVMAVEENIEEATDNFKFIIHIGPSHYCK
jgi:hypothetical protein